MFVTLSFVPSNRHRLKLSVNCTDYNITFVTLRFAVSLNHVSELRNRKLIDIHSSFIHINIKSNTVIRREMYIEYNIKNIMDFIPQRLHVCEWDIVVYKQN